MEQRDDAAFVEADSRGPAQQILAGRIVEGGSRLLQKHVQLRAGVSSAVRLSAPGRRGVGGEQAVERIRGLAGVGNRSEEHTSELPSLMRISYAVFCLQKQHRSTHTEH